MSSTAESFTHRGLGPMIRLSLSEGLNFVFTPREALTLSRALTAVKAGTSKVDEIYMSPIASDQDFVGTVTPDGLLLQARQPPLPLDWTEVGVIAESLKELAPEDPDA
ncbi:hypothetical protein [Beijerinckia indica]|uniref:Uncharacterized protein n=1 Tax=Beijerinckia indica subsp. indica (strain ATCC 9039 / DSM 1715 / NCIMB 8712) TaxID=395963 RepID=B2IJJ1_BEII9|nr:hypothetical protein [Beijerinckia indica]ACB94865.1 conserved hypothetical protein [Beijerinckia indica subsp. indica ATCC 9039]